ncbi:hypothetical protein NQ830_17700 [Clostridioides difficile]|nr:hypothetical protein [Clostridioides difficile]MCR1422154.1 hypothetical protein [Clostridioides difficile]MDM0242989.1 hypothetical protein [Clostridioides difficile]HBF9478678.1 hypothetical protein [Clostridioides difficile]
MYTILCCEEINETIILTDKNIPSLNEDTMISKHHRFIDIPKYKHNFIELIYVYSGSYTNQTFFYKKFKETYNLTPKKYRIKSRILLKEVAHETIYS